MIKKYRRLACIKIVTLAEHAALIRGTIRCTVRSPKLATVYLFAALLWSTGTLQAQPINTDQIWKLCNQALDEQHGRRLGNEEVFFSDNFKSGACFGYIRSLIETSAIILSAMEQLVDQEPSKVSNSVSRGVRHLQSSYCLPQHSDITDQVLNYLLYIENNPQERSKAAIYSFRRAMKATYPCQNR